MMNLINCDNIFIDGELFENVSAFQITCVKDSADRNENKITIHYKAPKTGEIRVTTLELEAVSFGGETD